MTFQELILALERFWSEHGCLIVQPYNSEVGAGTFNPHTFLRAIGPGAVERRVRRAQPPPDRRPLRRESQPPAAVPPVPGHPETFARSTFRTCTWNRCVRSAPTPARHDIRFIEDDWESPTLGAWGLGWQVWLDGLEISQFTYFQQCGGIDCKTGQRRAHVRARTDRDVPPGCGRRLRARVVARAFAMAISTSAPSGSGAPTTSSRPTCRSSKATLRGSTRSRSPALLGLQAITRGKGGSLQFDRRAARALGAPRLRRRHQVQPLLQRARRARRDQRDRAPALHRPGPTPRAGGGRILVRAAGGPRFPASRAEPRPRHNDDAHLRLASLRPSDPVW